MLKFLTSSTESSQSASGGTEQDKTGTDEPPSTSTGPVQPPLSSTDTGEEQAASATIHTASIRS